MVFFENLPALPEGSILYILAGAGILNLILFIAFLLRKQKSSSKGYAAVCILDALVFLLLAVSFLPKTAPVEVLPADTEPVISAPPATTEAVATEPAPTETEPVTEPEPTEPEPTEPEIISYLDNFHPHMVESSDPKNWDLQWEILVDGEVVPSYERPATISFGEPEDFAVLPGVSTFRGNNFRNNATYGITEIEEQTITEKWRYKTGSYNGWSGSGWTGQPLIAKWDDETRQIMNLYPEKKEKEDLVEVIYATLDGHIYFLDLDDGSQTRDPIFVGMNFKGAGSLDPRGYPLMYVGSGDIDLNTGKHPRMYIISLIDGEILWQYGNLDSMAYRQWCGYDGAPLIYGETDTMIWPGENGLFYTFQLNTQYNKAAGQISVNPEMAAVARYKMNRTAPGRYVLGMEDSAIMVGNYLYIAANEGMFFCVDINTMELIWVQDTLDDNNTTAVFEWGEDGHGYLYTSPALKWSAGYSGDLYIFKLDAQTGEILWKKPYYCYTEEDVPGGVLSSPALGKPGTDLEGLVFFSVSWYPSPWAGIITALDTETGETVWELRMDSYGWSSPVDVYTEDGKGYILMGCLTDIFYLIDGATGEVVSQIDLGGHIEASPCVYENTVIIGTRGSRIFGLELN